MTWEKAQQLCDGKFTSYLESFHRTILVYAPKTLNFEKSYLMRISLSVLDWNENIEREILATRVRHPAKSKKRSHGQTRIYKVPKAYKFRARIIHDFVHHPENWEKPYLSCREEAQIRRTICSQSVQTKLPKVKEVPIEEPTFVSKCRCGGGKSKRGCNGPRCSCFRAKQPCSEACSCSSVEVECLNLGFLKEKIAEFRGAPTNSSSIVNDPNDTKTDSCSVPCNPLVGKIRQVKISGEMFDINEGSLARIANNNWIDDTVIYVYGK